MEVNETPVAPASGQDPVKPVITESLKPLETATPTTATPAAPTAAVIDAEKAKKENDPEFASKFAALTRQEKAILQQRQALKADLEEVSKYKKSQELKKSDVLAYLEAEGVDIDSIVKAAIGKSSAEDLTVEEKIALLEKRIKEKEDNELKAKQQAEQAEQDRKNNEAVATYQKKLKDYIEANPDKYETIINQAAFDRVFEVQQQYFEEHQQLLPMEKVVDAVEEHLFAEAKKLSSLKKLKLQPETAESTTVGQAPNKTAPQKNTSPTLSSSMTAATSDSSERKWLTDEESKARAAKMLKFT